jgi:Putative auto-transporter adhesin, head GIN domain
MRSRALRPAACTTVRPGIPAALSAMLVGMLAAMLAGCSSMLPPLSSQVVPVRGEGMVTTVDRTAGEFRHVSVGGGLHVVATTGGGTSVTIAAQPNLLPLIVTDVKDGQLVVNVEAPGFSSSEPVTLTVVAPVLESLTLSGGASGTLDMVGATLAVDLSGGAVLSATGHVDSLGLTASGGARARLGELVAGAATIDASGGADAELTITGALTGTASGGATVHLAQKPASVEVTTSGGASVQGG